MTATQFDPLWNRAFVLLCVLQFLGYAQHFVLQPTILIYATVGLVIASFAGTSMRLQPLVRADANPTVMISRLLITVGNRPRLK